jgi:hypothetical protein
MRDCEAFIRAESSPIFRLVDPVMAEDAKLPTVNAQTRICREKGVISKSSQGG